AWGLACTLILLFFCLATTAQAVPPGTVIDNSAQASYHTLGTNVVNTSNTVSIVTLWPRTPAQLELLQYAPTVSGAQQVMVPQAAFDLDGVAGGATQQIAAVYPAGGGTPIDLSATVPLIGCSLYHQGEPVFLRVTDQDQNIDPTFAENVWVLASVSQTADTELLLLTESGPDTGIFLGYLQSGGSGTAQAYNGQLDVEAGAQVVVQYTDIADSGDTVILNALVDPYGLVFDSASGQPVNGAGITLVDHATGQPATVYGDDGVSAFPASITTGGTFTDSSGKVYAFGDGYYRFPFVAPGTYRLETVAPAGYNAPSSVATPVLQSLPGAPFAIAEPGSRGEPFLLNPGPAIRIDIPVDPGGHGLWVNKTVNRDTASVGDFIKYTVTVENSSGGATSGVRVEDRLPPGVRYRRGSARLNGEPLADPQISSNGRSLRFNAGDMEDGGSLQISYVTEIAAGARPGVARNSAGAVSATGLSSNMAVAEVNIKEDLFRSDNFIVGRVIADNCGDEPTGQPDGVAGVRIYLEDGTYVVTDEKGMYHFEAVSSGTHVVQLDLETLPEPYEIVLCHGNNRAAGTPFSRFVDLHGGALWREDFHVRSKPLPSGQAALRLSCGLDGPTVYYEAVLDVDTVPDDNLRLSIVLPEGTEYLPGSSRLTGQPLDDPAILENILTYRLGASAPGDQVALRFGMNLNGAAKPGRLHTKALLTFDTPGHKNLRTGLVETILALTRTTTRQVQPPLVVHPRFDSLSAELGEADRKMLDRMIERLRDLDIEHVVLAGYTDNLRVRAGRRTEYPDNAALSLARARAVARYLQPRLNLTPAQVTVVGKGADEPIASNATEEGRALNRRVEVRVMSARVLLVHDVETIKCDDQVAVSVQGQRTSEKSGQQEELPQAEKPFEMTRLDLDRLSPGFAVIEPAETFRPAIPSIKIAVQHGPRDTIELLLNNQPVSPLNFEGRRRSKGGDVMVSFWRGVDLKVGDNLITAMRKDGSGKERDRIERVV
ncbi:MAG: OmpA family protein, partial [Desulfosarcinaceae bacterium]